MDFLNKKKEFVLNYSSQPKLKPKPNNQPTNEPVSQPAIQLIHSFICPFVHFFPFSILNADAQLLRWWCHCVVLGLIHR